MKRKTIDPTNATLLEVVYARTGSLRKAARVGAYITAWGVCRQELGRTPTVEEYAEHWRQTRATAFREQAAFREAFPDLDTPDPICDVLDAAQHNRADFRAVAA